MRLEKYMQFYVTMKAQQELDNEGHAQQSYLVIFVASWLLPTLNPFYSSEINGGK